MIKQSDWLTYENLLPIVEEGDLIECNSVLYCHWAVYIGRIGTRHHVIHRVGELSSNGINTEVKKSQLSDLFGNRKCRINNYWDDKRVVNNPQNIVERAMSRVDDKSYNLLFDNCEHFATWCRYSQANSYQVKKALLLTAAVSSSGSSSAASNSCVIC